MHTPDPHSSMEMWQKPEVYMTIEGQAGSVHCTLISPSLLEGSLPSPALHQWWAVLGVGS